MNKNLTEKDITTFLSLKVGATVNMVESVKENPYNKSYRIDVPYTEKAIVMNPDNWPQGLVIKPYRRPRPRNKDHYNHFQRNQPSHWTFHQGENRDTNHQHSQNQPNHWAHHQNENRDTNHQHSHNQPNHWARHQDTNHQHYPNQSSNRYDNFENENYYMNNNGSAKYYKRYQICCLEMVGILGIEILKINIKFEISML